MRYEFPLERNDAMRAYLAEKRYQCSRGSHSWITRYPYNAVPFNECGYCPERQPVIQG